MAAKSEAVEEVRRLRLSFNDTLFEGIIIHIHAIKLRPSVIARHIQIIMAVERLVS